ncbi:MAG: glycosyltransferase family 39 protein [Nitrosopumilus sp.]|nr:glycosyltransferase family 39 protein [Nitrosopumilus sp.]
MITQDTLFRIGNFNFRFNHLLVIGILIIAFSVSFLIRSQGAEYGYELNEFDPFFNFRATQYLLENGLSEYFNWHDSMSWHPNGRDVSATSQTMLHITAALTYQIFGGNSSLYDFTILFPVVFGSLTTIVIFALVRVIGGTTAGLFAALFYSVSVPIVLRGTLGWFKSEPLGLFYGLLGLYLFLSGIKSENKKITISKLVTGGVMLGFGLSSWGGIQFFVIPIGIFILVLPFVRKDHSFLIWSIPLFVVSFLLTIVLFERPGIEFVFGLGGFSLIIPTGFLVANTIIQKFSNPENQTRNSLFFLFTVIIAGSVLIFVNADSEFLPLPSYRYLNAINPFLTTTDPLVDSVSEHATTTLAQSFFFHSVLMIFAGIGIWLILSRKTENLKNDMMGFALVIGLLGVYVSSAFVRLEVFASVSIIILSSIGLSLLTKKIFQRKSGFNQIGNPTKISFVIVITALLFSPLVISTNGNWIDSVKIPATILNGGTIYPIVTNDWKDSLEWIKKNTPEDSVIAAWWDYGYWITTLSERTTLADNATIDSKKISEIATVFLNPPDEAWNKLQEMDADYVLVFVAGQKIDVLSDQSLYTLEGGGDESKKQWFMRIAEEPLEKYLYSDGISGTEYFWNDTLLGQMFPFTVIGYVDLQNPNIQSEVYIPGFTPIYVKDIKYQSDGNGPLRLVYSSPGYENEKTGPMIGVFVYEINRDYL